MPTKGTPVRPVRVPDELWSAATAKAAERGENIADVIRAALRRYVARRPATERKQP